MHAHKVQTDNWVTVPTNSTLTIYKQTVMIHPVIDQYYNPQPAYVRSTKLARDQGQMSGKHGLASALSTPNIEQVDPLAEVISSKLERLQVVT